MPIASFYFEHFRPAWFWLLVLVGALALLVSTYAGMYRRSGRRLAWWLMGLRLAGVGMLLLAILKPVWSHQLRRETRPMLAVVVDNSESMSLPAADSDGRALARYQRARDWLDQAPVARQLARDFDVKWFGIDGRPLDKLPDEPQVEQTDLTDALERVAARVRGQGPRAVVLISDGQDTTTRASSMTLDEYPLPVFALGFGQHGNQENAFDVVLVSATAPERVRVHNSVAVQLLVKKDGGPALTVPLLVERGSDVLHRETIELPAGNAHLPLTVNFTPDEVGDFVLSARLEALADERTAANNAQAFRLRVEAEPIRVLLVEGTLRIEFTFLRDHLEQDPDVDLATLVRAASPAGASATAALLGGELITAERLKKIDVVLLGDFEARMLEDDSYRALHDWVDAGGGLMVLGGYENLSPSGFWQTPLAELLPVEPAGVARQIDRPFQFSLTPEGFAHPAMTLSGNSTEDAALWQALPPLAGVVGVGKAKPGAVVLARDTDTGNSAGRDSAEGEIVLAAQSFGKGRVGLLAADTTWRWSRLVRLAGRSDAMYVRFWSQWVRWLAGRDVRSQAAPLAVTTDKPGYRRGEKVKVTIHRNPVALVPGASAGATALKLSVRTPDSAPVELKPVAVSADPDTWTAEYFPERGGRFQIDAALTGAGASETVANAAADFYVRGSDLELDNPSTDSAILASIARRTGGMYADIDDTAGQARWLEALPTSQRVNYEVRTDRLWNHPLLLLGFVGLLTGEWFLRRRHHWA
ncbi:MAG TPA: glutamine amidotransferase [Pirellulales bacterium]|jgi:uncharacterized membrane protein|nr:glutamine amidotransferase [Pirellulales bacterium]